MMQQTRGIYLISVVAQTLDMHPQTLRKYERAGFIEPLRMGSLRTYSDEDVARLRLIKHFVDDMGLNLSGVQLALKMTGELLGLRQEISQEDRQDSAPGAEQDEPETDDAAPALPRSIKRIDEMLATLGVRVVQRPQPERNPPPGEGWFKVNPGEAVVFDPAPDAG